jgi:manganese/iron transport system permease protein
LSWLTDPLGYDFVLRALAEVVVMGATCGAIGAYVIVRRLAFIGDAISHAVFPGIVLAYLAGLSIFGGALVAGLITALGIALVARGGRIREDTAIGIFFAAAFALGIVLISTRHTFQGDLTGFLIGNLQGVSAGDIAVSAAVGLAIIVVLAAVHKELVLVSFDRTLASALGYPVFALDALLLVILTVTIVVSIQAVGIILVLAMLVTPAATARLLVDRFVPMLALGSLLGAVFGAALVAMAVVAGWRPSRLAIGSLLVGLLAGLVLVALPRLADPLMPALIGMRPEPLAGWVLVTTVVVAGEEALLRGALFGALERSAGPLAAVAVTSLAFALMHVPLYGWQVGLLDLGVGVWLAGLRLATGGVAAPALAHWIADLSTWWI